MFKLIIKQLWSRKKNNVWLFIELVIVTVVSWVVLDSVIVSVYDGQRPLGYDADRLCLINLADRDSDKEDMDEAMELFKSKLMQRGEVENVCRLGYFYPDNIEGNTYGNSLYADSLNEVGYSLFQIWNGEPLLQTYGIRVVSGGLSVEDIDMGNYPKDELVMTESMARLLCGTEQAAGRYVHRFNGDSARIAAVLSDVRMNSSSADAAVVFDTEYTWGAKLLVRLKPGVSPRHFAEEAGEWAVQELRTSKIYARNITVYEDEAEKLNECNGYTNTIRMNIVFAVFFLFNLCIGVVCTFWLQTRQRSEEVGVMRAFGATARRVVVQIMLEGFFLTTAAFIIGCLVYMQYVWNESLYMGYADCPRTDWVGHFGIHFAVVSAIVFLIMLVVVGIGIYIPVRGISRRATVEALNSDE
ncbi:MAG: ABC transporter permease [Bacteroides sp.]|nr:ABC transporter permease [Roseburia sp.]MCM1346389.1 ABC transporter permease [Bacteroides sp.]MCM1421784.1 ABC transporter permease [Bacteroides sp.]